MFAGYHRPAWGKATAKLAPANPRTSPSKIVAVKDGNPARQALSNPQMTMVCAISPVRLEPIRSTNSPSRIRRKAPDRIGTATIKPF